MVTTALQMEKIDYSLVGDTARAAVEKGLTEADWYQSPVPRETMRKLLERRNAPGIRDCLIWFGLLGLFGTLGVLLWGSGWAILPFAVYGVLYASSSDSRWHEASHGTVFKSDWKMLREVWGEYDRKLTKKYGPKK